jgi:ABC-type sulfate transport system permease subunit
VASLLAVLALVTLVARSVVEWRERATGREAVEEPEPPPRWLERAEP